MGESTLFLRRLIAALALTDVAYRLFMRESVRRALGIDAERA
jgi:hypothetical protein